MVAEVDDYCSFTKAVEHLGDRWNLLIVADLVASGPQGFNALAARLPGRIARSVLAERLRRLTDLGLVGRSAGRGPYRLTPAGEGLASTLLALRDWSTTWLPDDPAIVDRDPDVVLAWLTHRVARGALPAQPVVIEIRMRHERLHRCWLVLEHGQPPYGCLHDPLLDESRYVYIDAQHRPGGSGPRASDVVQGAARRQRCRVRRPGVDRASSRRGSIRPSSPASST